MLENTSASGVSLAALELEGGCEQAILSAERGGLKVDSSDLGTVKRHELVPEKYMHARRRDGMGEGAHN